MDTPDYSYFGTGNILMREYGSAAPLLPLGNCSKLNLSPQEEVKQLSAYNVAGGGLQAEVRRTKSVDLSYTFHDYSAENFARGLRSTATAATAGNATDEALVAYKGGYTSAAKIIKTITSVKSPDGVTTYTVDTDYSLVDSLLYLPSTTTIPDPVAGASNCKITYAYDDQSSVEALVNSNKQYELVFIGLNEARSGKRVRITCHKVSGGVLKDMAVLGEDFGAGDVSGALLADKTITATDVSQFFKIDVED